MDAIAPRGHRVAKR